MYPDWSIPDDFLPHFYRRWPIIDISLLLGTPFNLKVIIGKSQTILDLIKLSLAMYMQDILSDKSKVKFPNMPDAYEARIIDDEKTS